MATKGRGGPKTSAGKAVSSHNATKYGFTSQKPSTSTEKEIVSTYIQEFSEYYQPQSPLEKLQIERIAICKAKLDRLYEVERVQLELAIEKFNQDPDLVLNRIEAAEGVVLAMVKDLIAYGRITLPCNLSYEGLDAISKEISEFAGAITQEADLERHLPSLALYLNHYQATGMTSSETLLDKLKIVAQKIEYALNQKDQYRGRINQIAEVILDMTKESKVEEPTEAEVELDAFIKAQNEARQKRQSKKEVAQLIVTPEPSIDSELIRKQLHLLVELQEKKVASLQVYEQYQSTRDLMSRGLVLPQSESDLLMRYQTALDRRLSTAIGELLHLQSKRATSDN